MAASVDSRLGDLAKHWNELEARTKEAEQFREEPLVAAINEMRYAGRRIVDVLAILEKNGGRHDDEVEENLIVAKNYLINADHDVTDGICFFAHRRLRRVIEWHGVEKIKKFCPEFEEFYPEIIKAQSIIRTSREDRSKRKSEYDRLAKEYIPKLIAFHEKIKGILDLRLVDDIPAQLNILQRNVQTVAWIALFGSVASILSLILYVFG